ncbi:MAG: uroporphyrinogen-III synthase, partial [Bacteroidaceae bacterium]|nr:uroporphyrinogen-III synthase [Bacteroidaceae bacterium]
DYDMLIFFSPSGIHALKKNFPDFQQNNVAIGTFGANTAKAAKEAGLVVQLEAPTPKFPSITAALNDYIKNVNA